MTTATVRTVNVVHELRDGYFHRTAIDKRPVSGPVAVGPLGLTGDEQVDRSHGGRDRAVYVYADEDAAWWSEQLGRDIPPGRFGENLRTTGLDVTGARIGEQWRVGAMCRVRTEGEVRAGDPVHRLNWPSHPVTIGALASGSVTAEQMRELLDSGVALTTSVRNQATRMVSAS